MNAGKLFVCCVLLCMIVLSLTGCRNNLVNEWETYTGDTDVYYQEPTETSDFESAPSESATDTVEELAEYGLPAYWSEELWTVVDDSLALLQKTQGNSTAFLWYNDAHLSYSARRSAAILAFLQEYTDVQFINFGGDIVSDYDLLEHSEIVAQLHEWREATLTLSNHHSVVGNHDDDIEEFVDREDLYEFLLSEEPNMISADNNKFCYYVDNPAENTRYIYLSTGFDETTADDIRFLVDALGSTQKDWHIVVVSHIWFAYDSTETPTVGSVPDFAQVILNVLDAYNARVNGSEMEVEYDFTSAEARVEFCIGGHTHVDFEFRTNGGIPVILNETDSYHLRGEGKQSHNDNEAAVSVVIADYDAGEIHIIRAGRGSSRTVPMS